MPAAGALPLLLLLGADLFPVGLAVLVNQSDLGWEWCGGEGGLQVRPRLASFRLLLLVLSGQRQDDVSIEDAQRHAGDRVLEVVLGGEAVVQPGVRLVERLQKDAVVGLEKSVGAVELRDKRVKEPVNM